MWCILVSVLSHVTGSIIVNIHVVYTCYNVLSYVTGSIIVDTTHVVYTCYNVLSRHTVVCRVAQKPVCHTVSILTGRKCDFHTYVAL